MGSVNVQSNLASSIESLSSTNQDLHWKLQQQRLSTLFAEDGGRKEGSGNFQKLQFQNLENPKTDSCLNIETSRKDGNFSKNEWFLNSPYAAAATPVTASSNGNAGNWSGGIQAWTELAQCTSLP